MPIPSCSVHAVNTAVALFSFCMSAHDYQTIVFARWDIWILIILLLLAVIIFLNSMSVQGNPLAT